GVGGAQEVVGVVEAGGAGADVRPEAAVGVEEDALRALEDDGGGAVPEDRSQAGAVVGGDGPGDRLGGGDEVGEKVEAGELGEERGEGRVRVAVDELLGLVDLHELDQPELAVEVAAVVQVGEAQGRDGGVAGVEVGGADPEAAAPVTTCPAG